MDRCIIAIIMERGRKTEPRYENLFAHKAPPRVFDIDKEKYPALTTNTEANKTTNHISFFFTKRKYPKSNNNERIVVYILRPYALGNQRYGAIFHCSAVFPLHEDEKPDFPAIRNDLRGPHL